MRTSIPIKASTRDALKTLGTMGDSYDDVINELMKNSLSKESIEIIREHLHENETLDDAVKNMEFTINKLWKQIEQ